jgi:HTH-type transcriptional regulator/antitoxin HigA
MTTSVRSRTISVPKKRRPAPVSADYLALIRRFPLHPLRDDRDYDAAVEALDNLAVRPEGSLTPGEQDYFETLTMLVQAYDEQQADLATADISPLDMLKYLMEQSGMSTADLGRLLGNRGLASSILHGRRGLSKTHIRKLASHFKVSPALFLFAQ